jgi:hypothetical protein
MNRIRRIAVAGASAVISLIGFVVIAPAAFAAELAPPDGSEPASTSIGHGSAMAGWEIALIAVAAALLASALTAVGQRLHLHQTMRVPTA